MLLKETWNHYFCVTSKNQALHSSSPHFFKKLKNTMTKWGGTDQYNFKLFKNIKFEKQKKSFEINEKKYISNGGNNDHWSVKTGEKLKKPMREVSDL